MEKKNILKILLVSVAVIGLIYLIVDQFNKVGTTEGKIDYYDLTAKIGTGADSLSTNWINSSYDAFRAVLSDIDIAKGMQGITGEESAELTSKTDAIFKTAANSYFHHSSWADSELSHIKHIATYLHNTSIVSIVDGYYGAQNLIASSKACTTTSAVDNCIEKADSYNKAPWTNCTAIKDGLAQVRTNAMESYINRNLIPICNRLANYKANYTYFDDFDNDYQQVKNGKTYLESKSYSNSSFNSKYSSIQYNNAANDLDPRF